MSSNHQGIIIAQLIQLLFYLLNTFELLYYCSSTYAGAAALNLNGIWVVLLDPSKTVFVSLRYLLVFILSSLCIHFSDYFISFLTYSIDLEFKGPPDPLRGDEIYRRVREAAKVHTYFIFLCSDVTQTFL